MTKDQAIQLLGGSQSEAARMVGASAAAVSKWPEKLSNRITQRVVGALVMNGMQVPNEILKPNPHPALTPQGFAATENVGA